jgi:hypothetical protein
MSLLRIVLPGLVFGCIGLALPAQADTKACQARSGEQAATVVELYTSQGCDSCPPADRWLASLKGQENVIALAFHVDYWDRLGWKDPFGHPKHTARQAMVAAASGAGFSYTPQVLVNGRDWRRWPQLPAGAGRAVAQVQLERLSPTRVLATMGASAQAPMQLGLWWAWVAHGQVTQVLAGENKGALLRNEFVVLHYGQAAPFSAAAGAKLSLELPPGVVGKPGQSWVAVVTDARTGLPLQAARLGC